MNEFKSFNLFGYAKIVSELCSFENKYIGMAVYYELSFLHNNKKRDYYPVDCGRLRQEMHDSSFKVLGL